MPGLELPAWVCLHKELAGASHTRVHLEARRHPGCCRHRGGRNVPSSGCALAVLPVSALVAVGEDEACGFSVWPGAAAISSLAIDRAHVTELPASFREHAGRGLDEKVESGQLSAVCPENVLSEGGFPQLLSVTLHSFRADLHRIGLFWGLRSKQSRSAFSGRLGCALGM